MLTEDTMFNTSGCVSPSFFSYTPDNILQHDHRDPTIIKEAFDSLWRLTDSPGEATYEFAQCEQPSGGTYRKCGTKQK